MWFWKVKAKNEFYSLCACFHSLQKTGGESGPYFHTPKCQILMRSGTYLCASAQNRLFLSYTCSLIVPSQVSYLIFVTWTRTGDKSIIFDCFTQEKPSFPLNFFGMSQACSSPHSSLESTSSELLIKTVLPVSLSCSRHTY